MNTGASQRTFLIYKGLEKVFERVDLVLIRPNGEAPLDNLEILNHEFNLIRVLHLSPCLDRFFPALNLGINFPSLEKFARRLLGARYQLGVDIQLAKSVSQIIQKGSYDLIVARYLRSATQSGILGKYPVVIDVDDLPSEIYESMLKSTKGSFLRRMQSKRNLAIALREERKLLSAASGVWFSKQEDQKKFNLKTSQVLPNIPFDIYQPFTPPPFVRKGVKNLLLLGLLSWGPNFKGFDHFIHNVWPAVRLRHPDAILRVVGKGMTDQMKQRWGSIEGVQPIGFIENVRGAYSETLVSVAPIYQGGGTNIKVIESLFYGRPCVCTEHAARGYLDLSGLRVAHSDSDFAEQINTLLSDYQTCLELGIEGRKSVLQSLSFENFSATVRDICMSAGGKEPFK
jgi:polysaccharide biosynthesis protein PslH